MALTLTRMRALVRKGLGNLSTTQLSDPEVDELLNMSLWEVSDKYGFKEKECLRTLTLTAGTGTYALPADIDAIITVSVVDDEEGTFSFLRHVEFNWYEENASNDDVDRRAKPQNWMRRDNALVLYPIPDKDYVLRLMMYKNIATMVSGSVDTADLPRNWHEIVVEGAVVRGHFYNEDYNLAQQAENFKINKERSAQLVNSKEQTGNKYSGLQVVRDARDVPAEY